ncbi:MAG: precorrin-8X methylmutase [Fusobacterium varium]|jgi:precorrin-8X/cobalt-precorrin-8 methylmutase|uniref:Precorrin-8X methylmutase n=1 Tax=Fusobacterium varium ATCC 27725 TaxID=469618 RepID=A0ABN5JLJ5_FUSVA|nr:MULTISPECIES: precorrin-8X methylmutase [Fusobacterium]AVQ32229.1 precorrin-8X methylmutase [Fusobacterium varium ATCC 27725]EES63920.1 precorrin-8X methylmutase [Fusobacterium varium ATCC 27725]MCF2673990.1 precorrin-8X methylmutase [Fusobacterium varium]MCI6032296.1 precorrin-8X methylmutase [Fusobacterium varium]MDY4004956.1 precorrin-8X methylmutase [Fusobacterium varium]
MNNYIKVPQDIEKRSFEIIGEELGDKINKFDEATLPVIKRVIHTTADFEYADLIEFMNDAINSGKEALKKGCKIYCDTNMIVNGASKMVLSKFNCEAYCLVADSEVVKEAKEKGVTRSIVGMEKAAKDPNTKIFLIGNAPTALYQLKEMIERNEIEKPALVVGVPVGFVGAAESKEAFKSLGIPYITINGRKGGSTVAVSILHGILYQMYQREGF